MRKTLYALAFSVLALSASCSKEEPGGTATEPVAGQWYVTVDAVDASGEVVYTDDELFQLGRFISISFNTAENVPNKMYLSDLGNFWDYQVEVDVDLASKTFSTAGSYRPNLSYDCDVKVRDGKIMLKAATTPSGMPADSIVYYVNFDDDDYPEMLGYDAYRISGYRYTGFAADE